ncbi:electron transfer flavoprotein subunit beta [Enterovibrio sp. ZSDZ35]|uniref:Electron transfer flavoprotein subunit beta n=1 Tax=Enterovibrio qingdaonensis TaxID=2899818 RepID=A0ABT5QRN1_9GAMM|nr:electron transfer flavoprotein subunit beta [Enterovibrio sp. ZSDZ35]MDD1783639.1 electron transfer flavoprotein subunit beta [Enterovibrio sp. ZSDZ35]
MQANKTLVLVSEGLHPLSERARRAENDAKALELALQIGHGQEVVFAGDPSSPALREYLGMGLHKIDVLNIPDNADAALSLASYAKAQKCSVVLCGARAEHGESSGMVPYLVGDALGATIVPEVVSVLDQTTKHIDVLQALAGGQRRKLRVSLPVVLIAGASAPAPRQSAFTVARDGVINVLEVKAETDTVKESWQWLAAKKRPKRTKAVAANASSRDRFLAATAAQAASGGKVMANVSPKEGAEAILAQLKKDGVI